MCVKAWVMPLVYLDYQLRKAYIVQNFCENKDRPQLKCDGKCYLAKRIAAAQEQDEKNAGQRFISHLLEIITDCREFPCFTVLTPAYPENLRARVPYKNPFIAQGVISDFFRPPLAPAPSLPQA